MSLQQELDFEQRVGDVADVVIFFFLITITNLKHLLATRTFSLSVVILRRAELKE